MNSLFFTLCAVSPEGQYLYFDHFGFTLLKRNAYHYRDLGVAVIAARLESDVNGIDIRVLDADGDTVASVPAFPVFARARSPQHLEAAPNDSLTLSGPQLTRKHETDLVEVLERLAPSLETAAHLVRLHGDHTEADCFLNDARLARGAIAGIKSKSSR